jgi:hypothetical protein
VCCLRAAILKLTIRCWSIKDLIIYLVHSGVVDIFIGYYVSSKQLASCCVTIAGLANTVSPFSISNQKETSDKWLGACDTC